MDKIKILYVNATSRNESRTNILAQYLLNKLNGDIDEIKLEKKDISPLNSKTLNQRDEFINKKDYSSSIFNYAKQYSNADIIVISAPYWDLSFPALLKAYIENINVLGITFKYTDSGIAQGLCKAKRMFYVTTSGGPIISDDFGFGYIKSLANNLHGIKNVEYIKAQGLDIYGANIDDILNNTKIQIDNLLK